MRRDLTSAAAVALGLIFAASAARADLVVQACTSCELDTGGTGVAMKNHIRGQLLAGHDVVAVLVRFPEQKEDGTTIEASLADVTQGKPARTNHETKNGPKYTLTKSTLKNGKTLAVFRIVSDQQFPWVDQEEKIKADIGLLPKLEVALDAVMTFVGSEKKPILSYQMHVYWNMVMEKALARRMLPGCKRGKAPLCMRAPVAMWAHSDENAYSGKQKGDNIAKARIRASALLKDMIHSSDAVFTVSTPSRDQFLAETDLVAEKGLTPSPGKPQHFKLTNHDPKGKGIDTDFYVAPRWELCDPLRKTDKPPGCRTRMQKYVLPVFNGIRAKFTRQQAEDRKKARPQTKMQLLAKLQRPADEKVLANVKIGDPSLKADFKRGIADLTTRDKIVLSVGRINRSKNPMVLVTNWHLVGLPDAHLVIAGPAEESEDSKAYFKDLMKAIRAANAKLAAQYKDAEKGTVKVGAKTGPKARIHYVGPIYGNPVSTDDLYTAADVFVSPSLAETQGMTVLEAMSLGTPVVATASVPSYAEFVRDGVNGYMANPSEPAFYQKIRGLLTDEGGVATRFTARGLKTFSYYTIEGIAARTNWAMKAVQQRVKLGANAKLPLKDEKPIPNWTEIQR